MTKELLTVDRHVRRALHPPGRNLICRRCLCAQFFPCSPLCCQTYGSYFSSPVLTISLVCLKNSRNSKMAAVDAAEAKHVARLNEVQRALDSEIENRRGVQSQVRCPRPCHGCDRRETSTLRRQQCQRLPQRIGIIFTCLMCASTCLRNARSIGFELLTTSLNK